MLGAAAAAWSATVYKWVDADGVTHYSDQPNPGAQKLQIAGAQTYEAQAAAVGAPPTPSPAPAAAPPVCVIDSPGAGQVFLDTFSVTGHVTLAHVGGVANQTTLRMDGMDISSLLSATGSFTLSQVDRGDHTLTLQVNNPQGEVACQAAAVTFSVRQRSLIPPTAPTAPAAPTVPGVLRHSSS
ncbi:MAG TPA: DUF4124 domain-containing protein [Steroidobacteraceae bacterium]|jgi:hypothetical protein